MLELKDGAYLTSFTFFFFTFIFIAVSRLYTVCVDHVKKVLIETNVYVAPCITKDCENIGRYVLL